jgi:integrase
MLRSLNLGWHRPQSSRTLAEFVAQDWKIAVEPSLKYSTTRQYNYLLATHILPAVGDRRLCDLSREQLQPLVLGKLHDGLAWETVAHIKNVLSNVLGKAVEWGYLHENAARLVKLPRRELAKQRPFLTLEQVHRLLAALNEPSRSIVLLLVLTGLRIGELLALRWSDVDIGQSSLRVRQTVYQGRFDTPKTQASAAPVPLSREAIETLIRLAPGHAADGLVFANRNGSALNARNLLRRALRPACVAAGVPRITWHSLRHTHATLLAAQGEPVKTIQSQLRHSTVRLSLELYTHQIPSSQREAVERLDEQLFGPKWTQVGGNPQQASRRVQ